MRTVVFVYNRVGFGGAERYLAAIASAVDPQRYRRIVTLPGSAVDWGPEFRYRNCDMRVLDLNRRFRADLTAALAFFRRTACDIVHFNRTWETQFIGPAIAARLAGRRVVITEHWEPTPLPRLARQRHFRGVIPGVGLWRLPPLARRCGTTLTGRLAHAVITVARRYRVGLVQHYRYPAASTHVIHNGVDIPAGTCTPDERANLRIALGASGHNTLVGTVARLSREKGVDLLIKAAACVVRVRSDVRFVVIGEGPARPTLASLIESTGLREHVALLGFRADVAALMHALDVLVAPSRVEGCSYAILDAMASGRPVVATSVGGNPELIEHRVTGLLVPPEDPDAMAAAILSVLDNPRLGESLGKQATDRVRSSFSLEGMLSRTLPLLLGDGVR